MGAKKKTARKSHWAITEGAVLLLDEVYCENVGPPLYDEEGNLVSKSDRKHASFVKKPHRPGAGQFVLRERPVYPLLGVDSHGGIVMHAYGTDGMGVQCAVCGGWIRWRPSLRLVREMASKPRRRLRKGQRLDELK